MMLKGMTAGYLLRRTHAVKPGDTVLYHAAAGGVGLMFGQWAKHLGATVIGTAGSADKIALAKAHGFDHVINYRDADFVAAVREITGGRMCDVVYDSVGKDTFPASLDCLQAAWPVRELRPVVRPDPALQHGDPVAEGLAVRDAPDDLLLYRQAQRPRCTGRCAVRRGRQGHRQGRDQPALCAGGRGARRMPTSKGAGRPGRASSFRSHLLQVKTQSAGCRQWRGSVQPCRSNRTAGGSKVRHEGHRSQYS